MRVVGAGDGRLDDPAGSPGHWLDTAPDAFVLPEWLEIAIRRDSPGSAAARELNRLESGAAGYRLGRRWRSGCLQRDFYSWLDPAFAGQLWQGEIGFTVYLRDKGEDALADPAPSGQR